MAIAADMTICFILEAMVALQDEEMQQNGVVALFYNVGFGVTPHIDKDLFFSSPRISNSLPLRFVARHYCYDNMKLKPVLSLLRVNIETNGRVRFRAHFGEC